jgi:hypothetical protein
VKTSKRPSKQVHFRDSLHQHLHMYALAAGAAGVGVLALTQPSEAEIIYTPADSYFGPGGRVYLDVSGDGTTDFFFSGTVSATTSSRLTKHLIFTRIYANPAGAGDGFADNGSPLSAGASIGPPAEFMSASFTMATGWFYERTGGFYEPPRNHDCSGLWDKVRNRYLGLKFMISGEVHYGWARLSVTCSKGSTSGRLSGYAYETIPNQGLKAGQKKEKLEDENWTDPAQPTPPSTPVSTPATLGMLATGAPALSIWRRDSSSFATLP